MVSQAPNLADHGLAFDPPPHLFAHVIADLVNPELSLGQVARKYQVTLMALVHWTTRDDVAAEIHQLESFNAQRCRLAAAAHLPAVVSTLANILREEKTNVQQLAMTEPTHHPSRLLVLRHRQKESARRAATLLAKLARLMPPPRSGSPSLREGAGGRVTGSLGARPAPAVTSTGCPRTPGPEGVSGGSTEAQPAEQLPAAATPSLREGAGGRVQGSLNTQPAQQSPAAPAPAPSVPCVPSDSLLAQPAPAQPKPTLAQRYAAARARHNAAMREFQAILDRNPGLLDKPAPKRPPISTPAAAAPNSS